MNKKLILVSDFIRVFFYFSIKCIVYKSDYCLCYGSVCYNPRATNSRTGNAISPHKPSDLCEHVNVAVPTAHNIHPTV